MRDADQIVRAARTTFCKIKGQKVKLHSLIGRPELNGRAGLVLSYDTSSGRVGVKVDGEDHPIALKPTNLSEQDETRDALVGAGLTETQCDDLFALGAKLPTGLLAMGAGENADVDLPPLLKVLLPLPSLRHHVLTPFPSTAR